MLYATNEMSYHAGAPLRVAARMARDFWSSPLNPASRSDFARKATAGLDLYANLTRRYGKPDWRIDTVSVDGHPVRVRQNTVWSSPWVNLIHFARDPAAMRQAGRRRLEPAVLIVAPLSGHYATLLRGTVEAFLQDHEVYVTDWTNAREVPVLEGRFDFYDYIDHVRAMLAVLGPRPHVLAVCQPGPPVLAAASLMAEDGDPSRPASMTFMGSPIDARLSPTVTNKLAEERPFAWFKSNMIHPVPFPYAGALRSVYPGFVQLFSFMSMNAARHQDAHKQYFQHLVRGDGENAAKHMEFYDEYLSVLDLTEEFYLQTVDIVFQQHLLPRGLLHHRGRLVRPEAITDIGLMTVEGALDDISGVGQTQAAHALCANIPDEDRELFVHPDVGHYGVFNGRRFRDEIYPKVRGFIERRDSARDEAPARFTPRLASA